MRAESLRRLGVTAVVCLVTIFVSPVAEAHSIGLSRGEYRATAEGLAVEIVLAQAELLALVPSLDLEKDAMEDADALAGAESELENRLTGKIIVTRAGVACAGNFVDVSPTELDGLKVRARYACGDGPEPLTVRLPLLADLSRGHRHAASIVSASGVADVLLLREHAELEVPMMADAPTPTKERRLHWTGFVRMGLEHILTGYDHLLFLFALVLGGGRLGSLALNITSFTVAHCFTLTLAVLGIVSAPARVVEPAIALSVAYVGAESLLLPTKARFPIAFPFGLLHGFGFAGALAEIAIPPSDVPRALASFNLGVELGQLVWILVLGWLVNRLRRLDWFARRAVPVLAVAIVGFGLAWFVGRADFWHG